MRLSLAALLLVAAATAGAQTTRPPNLQPVPEPPAPPVGMELDPALEPTVTIKRDGGNTVEEYRIGGRLYMMKVTPQNGPPFYLVDDRGDGKFARHDAHDSGVRPPMWVIHTF
jgi:hypothetical protein